MITMTMMMIRIMTRRRAFSVKHFSKHGSKVLYNYENTGLKTALLIQ